MCTGVLDPVGGLAEIGQKRFPEDVGSPEDVLADSATQAEWDALNIRQQGEAKARGYTIDSDLSRARASNASQQGYLSAAGTLLGGTAKAAAQYAAINGEEPQTWRRAG